MDYLHLRKALDIGDAKLTVLPDTLTPNIADLLTRCFAGQPIVITGAATGPGDGENETIVVSGRAAFLNVADLPVEARFSVDARGRVRAFLKYRLLGETPGPNDWRFSRSFPSMPKVVDWDKTFADPTTVPLDELVLFDAYYIVVGEAQEEPDFKVSLQPGINFVGRMRPSGAVGIIESLFGNPRPLTLHGAIRIPLETQSTLPLKPFQFPWDAADPIPGILLQGELGVDQALGRMNLGGIAFRIYTPLTQEWLQKNPSYAPVLGYTGKLSIPSADIAVNVTAPMQIGGSELQLIGQFEGVSVGKLAGMIDIAGTGDLLAQLPEQMQNAGAALGRLQLTHAAVGLSFGQARFEVASAAFTLGLPDFQWHVWDDHFLIEDLSCRFDISQPFGKPEFGVTVLGRCEIEGVPLDVFAGSRDGFTVYAELAERQTLPLERLMRTYAPGVPPPGDLSIDRLRVSVAPFKSYAMAVAIAGEPHPWVIDVGFKSLRVSEVVLALAYPRGGPVAGSFGGAIAFGDVATLRMRYDIPGDFVLRADFPKVGLNQLIATLCNQPVKLPGGFDVDFLDSSVLIQKSGAGLAFRFGTVVEAFGSFALEVRKVSAGQSVWGFAAAMDLESGKASGLGGLSGLGIFEEFFGLQRLLLVVSSFDDAQFKFPDLAAFNHPAIRTGSLALPAQAQGVIAGLNVYAQWTIDTSKKEQKLLARLLGLSPTLGVTLQIGENPAQDSRLSVSYRTTINKLPLSCQFGGQIKNGSLGLFLSGQMTVSIQGQNQTFDLTLLFVANGAFMSASAKGATPIAFKFEGTKICELGNLALVIGTNWEGIPSLGVAGTIAVDRFQSSVAVFFDSAEPAKSMVAGSLSDLSLKDILDTLTGNVIPSEIDGFLDQVAVKGTRPFTIPGALADDLDNLKLEGVAAAFAARGVIIPSESQNVFLVVGQRGSRWNLTDMTNKARHYQLVKQGATILVTVDAQFYCVPQRTSIGALPAFDPAFYVNGAISFFGFDASATIDISPNQGIAVDGRMDRLVIGTEALFSLRAAEGGGGPRVSVATFTRPSDPNPQFRPPHFYVNGHLEMLGLSREIYANLSARGMEFDLNGDLLPAMRFDLHGTAGGPSYLGVGGGVNVGVGVLDLGPLGKIDIGTGVDGKLDIEVSAEKISATMQGEFQFAGKGFKVPEFDLGIRTDAITGLAVRLYEMVKKILLDFLKDAAVWAEFVGKGFITSVSDMAAVLKDTYKVAAQEAARIMRAAGRPVAEVSAGLKSTFGLTAQAAGAALKGAGYAANEVAAGLKSAYALTAEAAAGVLKQIGYGVNEIGGALRGIYGQGAAAAAAILKGLGFGANQVAGALQNVFGLTGQAAAAVLKGVGFGANAVAGALKSVFNLGADAVKSALGAAGYAASEVAKAVGGFFTDIGHKLDPRHW